MTEIKELTILEIAKTQQFNGRISHEQAIFCGRCRKFSMFYPMRLRERYVRSVRPGRRVNCPACGAIHFWYEPFVVEPKELLAFDGPIQRGEYQPPIQHDEEEQYFRDVRRKLALFIAKPATTWRQ